MLSSLSINAQTEEGTTIVTQDFETWSKLGLKYKPHEKFTIGIDQGFRFNHNSTIADQILTD
jgi:hypothetical protein